MILSSIVAPALRGLSSAGAILCYHGMTSLRPALSTSANMTLLHFMRTLEVVLAIAQVVPLAELVRRHRSGRSTAGLVALTFDDAYASTLSLVLAEMRRLAAPFTVFAVSGAVRRGGRFWWDRLEEVMPHLSVAQHREFERTLQIPPQGQEPVATDVARRFWRVRDWVLTTHAGRWPDPLEDPLRQLEEDTGVETTMRSLNTAELQELARDPLVSVGVHTRSHAALTRLGDADVRAEVRRCFHELREVVPNTVPILAAPYGLHDARTVDLARDAGMDAVMTLEGTTLAPCARERPALPRLSVSQRHAPWKLQLAVASVKERLQGIR